jgi:hypothetical protein
VFLKRITSPHGYPISTDFACGHLREVSDDEKGLINSYIGVATRHVERMTNRALLSQQWLMTRERFPVFSPVASYVPFGGALGGTIGGYPGYVHGWPSRFGYRRGEDHSILMDLRVCPVQSVDSVTYVDGSGDTQTLDPSLYESDTISEPGRVCPVWGGSWPYARQQPNSVQVTFTAGYATPFTANATTDVLTAFGRTYANDEKVRLSIAGWGGYVGNDTMPSLPPPFVPYTDYYVVNSTGSQFQLSTSQGGAAIDITGTGSGDVNLIGEIPETAIQAILFMVGHYWTNREAVSTDTISKEMELGVDPLLWDLRWSASA